MIVNGFLSSAETECELLMRLFGVGGSSCSAAFRFGSKRKGQNLARLIATADLRSRIMGAMLLVNGAFAAFRWNLSVSAARLPEIGTVFRGWLWEPTCQVVLSELGSRYPIFGGNLTCASRYLSSVGLSVQVQKFVRDLNVFERGLGGSSWKSVQSSCVEGKAISSRFQLIIHR
jgi:hypothetical protein